MNATTARPLLRQALARQHLQHLRLRLAHQQQRAQPFSIMYSLRTFARSFEPHPFQRLPVTSVSQPADWGRIVRRVAGQAVVYFPLGFAILGWPSLAPLIFNGHM